MLVGFSSLDQWEGNKSVLVCPKHKLATVEKQSSNFGVTYLLFG